jgi:hypothetical protein
MKDGEEETLQQVLWDLLGTQVNLCRQISCLTHERDAALADLEACRQELLRETNQIINAIETMPCQYL